MTGSWVDAQLVIALRDGPFADALRLAIAARGLSLDRLTHRLALRDISVSTATLSYWSRGRSRPGRPESLLAVAALEEILELPPNALRQLLMDRPRAGQTETPVPLERLWGEHGASVLQVAEQIGLPGRDRRTLSLHERYVLDGDGAERACRVIMVLEALSDEVDHFVVVYHDDDDGKQLPHISSVSGCDVSTVRRDEAGAVQVARMQLDRVLQRGERTAVEYELMYRPGGSRSSNGERRFATSIRQYVLEIVFDPEAMPARCYAVREPTRGKTTRRELQLDGTHSARMVLLDASPGTYRIEWEWD